VVCESCVKSSGTPQGLELTDIVYTSGPLRGRGIRDREGARPRAARRLAVIRHAQEVTGNVSMTCRYFGITRQAFYKWLRRYEEQVLEGLRDRSRRPHVIPHATKPEVVSKIVYLRQHYHFGVVSRHL